MKLISSSNIKPWLLSIRKTRGMNNSLDVFSCRYSSLHSLLWDPFTPYMSIGLNSFVCVKQSLSNVVAQPGNLQEVLKNHGEIAHNW